MVDLVKQLREVKERDFSPESLKTMVMWGADEIERLREAMKDATVIANHAGVEIRRLAAALAAADRSVVSEG